LNVLSCQERRKGEAMELDLDQPDPLDLVDTDEALRESPDHNNARDRLAGMLKLHFRERSDVYVGSNVAIQHDRDDASKIVAADLFVAFDPPAGGWNVGRSWRTWLEGVPAVVIEVASPRTVAADQGKKLRLYRRLGVREYLIFDPRADDPEESCLPEAIVGWRRRAGTAPAAGAPREFEAIPTPDSYESPLLGLRIEREGRLLRLVDPRTGRRIPTLEEAAAEAEQARQEAEQARRENAELKQRLARLEADLARLREGGDTGR
jgi:Uma2 family endonuclease